MLWTIMLLTGMCAGVLLFFIARMQMRQVRVSRRLHRLTQLNSEEDGRGGDIEWLSLLRALAAPLARGGERTRLGRRLASAGFRKPWSVDVFLFSKLAVFLTAAVAGCVWLEIDPGSVLSRPLNTLQYLFLLFLAARAPDWWLTDQIKRRRAKIRASVPQAIDLLTICVESGVSLEEAFLRVSREVRSNAPEVAVEFRVTRSEMLVMDRSEALRRLERRSGVRELESLASSLLQSIHYGTPIADALRTIAADSRDGQVAEMEEKAGAISARVGIPLVVLILFPLVALIVAPAAINLMRTF